MKRSLLAIFLAFSSFAALASAADAPLRVFLRSGPKSHGPGAHDYPRFLAEWVPLLNARGAKATGANAFPRRSNSLKLTSSFSTRRRPATSPTPQIGKISPTSSQAAAASS